MRNAVTTEERRSAAGNDTCWWTQKVSCSRSRFTAKVMDQEGIKPLLERAGELFSRLSYLWLDSGYRGEDKGKDWVEKALGWTVELVERPRKPAPKRC